MTAKKSKQQIAGYIFKLLLSFCVVFGIGMFATEHYRSPRKQSYQSLRLSSSDNMIEQVLVSNAPRHQTLRAGGGRFDINRRYTADSVVLSRGKIVSKSLKTVGKR